MISEHEVRVVRTLRLAAPAWLTAREIADRAQVSGRTGRQHLSRLDRLGAVETAQIHPGPRYRLAEQPTETGRNHLEDVQRAGQLLGDTSADNN